MTNVDTTLVLQARELYASGLSMDRVAKTVGISPTTVRKYCHDVARKATPMDFINQRREKGRQLYKEGKTHKQIAQACGVSEKSVSGWLEDLVVPREVLIQKKADARALYMTGLSLPKIAQQLDVSKSSVFGWCRDLVETKNAAIGKIKTDHPICPPPYDKYRYYETFRKETQTYLVTLIHIETKKHIRLQRSRYNMSVHLGRLLKRHEVVKRVSGSSDDISNLDLTSWADIKQTYLDQRTITCENPECARTFARRRTTTQYCSVLCRQTHRKAKNALLRQTKPKVPKPQPKRKVEAKPCAHCQTIFTPKRKTTKTCSPTCRDAYRAHLLREVARQNVKEKPVHTCKAPDCDVQFTPRKSAKGEYCSRACATRSRPKKERAQRVHVPKLKPTPKTPKPAFNVFHNECVFCEETFKCTVEGQDVCAKPACRELSLLGENHPDFQ